MSIDLRSGSIDLILLTYLNSESIVCNQKYNNMDKLITYIIKNDYSLRVHKITPNLLEIIISKGVYKIDARCTIEDSLDEDFMPTFIGRLIIKSTSYFKYK